MTQIPSEAFKDILEELRRHPVTMNEYRTKAGAGCSQTFGIVNKRSLAPDYSRQNWYRPYLYHLLLEFAKKYVTIGFNSITINSNYKAAKHRDKNNKGDSFLVAFGEYQGGALKIFEGELMGSHNICCNPIVTDFSKVYHEVEDFTGERYSLVFYTFESPRSVPLPPWELRHEDGRWWFYRDGIKITKQNGIPHPLRGRKVKEKFMILKQSSTVTFE
jgi:fermentation-respiration switch protein FrsA (DUF1100 family)